MADGARPPRPSAPLEADLYGPIMRAVSEAGARIFRNHVGVSQHRDADGDDRTVRHGLPKGSSDLIGWTADGKFLAIEVKRPGWKPSPKWLQSPQAAFIRAVRAAGGVAFVARSTDEAVRQLTAGRG